MCPFSLSPRRTPTFGNVEGVSRLFAALFNDETVFAWLAARYPNCFAFLRCRASARRRCRAHGRRRAHREPPVPGVKLAASNSRGLWLGDGVRLFFDRLERTAETRVPQRCLPHPPEPSRSRLQKLVTAQAPKCAVYEFSPDTTRAVST